VLTEAPINLTTNLALLALRRFSHHFRLFGSSETNGQFNVEAWASPGDSPRVKWVDLARALRHATDRLWLTIEVFLSWRLLEPKLNLEGRTALRVMGECSFFRHLDLAGSDDWQQLVREIHNLREIGKLSSNDLDIALLRHEFSYPTWRENAETNLQEEWNVLWELAAEMSRGPLSSIGPLFQIHTDQGDSLLVALLVLFVNHQLKLPEVGGPKQSRVPDQVIKWLFEEKESLKPVLDEIVAGSESPEECAPDDSEMLNLGGPGSNLGAELEPTALRQGLQKSSNNAATHVARGDAYRLRAEYELAVAEYTGALEIESNNIAALIRRGQCFGLQGHHERAIEDFTAALRINPRSELALHHRGRALAGQNNLAAAIIDLNEALQINPENAWTFHYRGETWFALREVESALLDFNSAIRLNPDAALSYICRASVYSQNKQFDQAIADYSDALRLDPQNFQTFLKRGVAYREAGRLEMADQDFQRASELDPTNIDLIRERAVLDRLRGDYEKALTDLNTALERGGDHADCYYQRGLVYKSLGVWKRALEDFNAALQLNSRLAQAFDHRAEIYASQDRNDLALEDVRQAIAINPSFTMAYVHYARLLMKVSRLKEAITECDQAIKLDPSLAFAHLTRGTIASHRGDYQTAIESFTEVIRLEPANARALYHRGLAHAKRNSLNEAVHDLTESLQLEPQARTFADRATVLARLGEHAKAVSDLASAVRLDSRFAANYCNFRAQVHRRQQRFQWAAADYRLALLFDKDNVSARTGLAQVLRTLKGLRAGQQKEGNNRIGQELDSANEKHPVGETKSPAVSLESTSPEAPSLSPAPPHDPQPKAIVNSDDVLIDFAETPQEIPEEFELESPKTPTADAIVPNQSSEKIKTDPNQNRDISVSSREKSAGPEIREIRTAGIGSRQAIGVSDPTPAVKKYPPSTRPQASASSETVSNRKDTKHTSSTASSMVQTKADASSPTTEYEEEQARILKREQAEEAKRTAQLQAEAELKRKRDEAWAAARRAKPAETDDEDSDQSFFERLERWKKPLVGVAAALLLAVIGYYAWGSWRVHQQWNPPMNVDVVWQDYSDDPTAANKKYANRFLTLVGRLIIDPPDKSGRRRVYFEPPEGKTLRIRCTFIATGELAEVSTGHPPGYHRISGKIEPYEEGPIIEMSNCEYISCSSVPLSMVSAPQIPLAGRGGPEFRIQKAEIAFRHPQIGKPETGTGAF
jgi:tetratricopeptide (TPR) repeat protein